MRHVGGQLFRNPKIIGITKPDELPQRGRDASVTRASKAPVPLMDHTNPRVARKVVGHFGRSIARAVIDDDDFIIVKGLLQKRCHGVGQCCLDVMGGHDDRSGGHGHCLSRQAD